MAQKTLTSCATLDKLLDLSRHLLCIRIYGMEASTCLWAVKCNNSVNLQNKEALGMLPDGSQELHFKCSWLCFQKSISSLLLFQLILKFSLWIFFSCRLPTAAQLSLFTSKASSFYMRFETKPCQPLRELHLEFQYRDFIKTKF